MATIREVAKAANVSIIYCFQNSFHTDTDFRVEVRKQENAF